MKCNVNGEIYQRLPSLQQSVCRLPRPVCQREAGGPGLVVEATATHRHLLHGVVVSAVSRQVRQLTVLARGGDIRLHGVTNTVL